MAINAYSNLYGLAPNGEGTYIYKGAWGERQNQVETTVFGTVDVVASVTLADTDDAVELMRLPAGAKITALSLIGSTDMDSGTDFTFDLGTADDPDVYTPTPLTTLQGTAETNIAIGVLLNAPAVPADDAYGGNNALLLTRVADALDQSGQIRFRVSYVIL